MTTGDEYTEEVPNIIDRIGPFVAPDFADVLKHSLISDKERRQMTYIEGYRGVRTMLCAGIAWGGVIRCQWVNNHLYRSKETGEVRRTALPMMGGTVQLAGFDHTQPFEAHTQTHQVRPWLSEHVSGRQIDVAFWGADRRSLRDMHGVVYYMHGFRPGSTSTKSMHRLDLMLLAAGYGWPEENPTRPLAMTPAVREPQQRVYEWARSQNIAPDMDAAQPLSVYMSKIHNRYRREREARQRAAKDA